MTKFLLLLFTLWSTSCWSQIAQDRIEVDTNLEGVNLNKALWFFEDVESRYTSSELLAPSFQKNFAATTRLSPNFGFTKSSWWAMVPLRNKSNHVLPVIVTEAHTMVDAIDFWLVNPNDGSMQHVRMGDRIPHDINRQFNRQPSFQTDLPPGDSLLYMRIKTEGTALFNITLYGQKFFNSTQIQEYGFLYTSFGILLVMGLYNFFIWLQLRKVSYLVYFGFIITMVAQSVAYSGIGVHIMDDYTWFMNEGYVAIADCAAMLAFIFPLVFLSLRGRHPWLTRLCYLGTGMAIISSLCLVYSYEVAGKLAILTSTMASAVTLSCGIVCSLKRFRPAYFFTLAWLVLIIGNVFHMATLAGHFPASFWAEWGVMVGSVVEVVLLSLALADKVRLSEAHAYYRIETLNRDLQKEHESVLGLNNSLERMVDEQTREIKSILKHIQIGIVVVSKNSMLLTDNFSDSAKTIFQTDFIAGARAVELILGRSNVGSELQSQVSSILECSLGESSDNFDFNAHMLPKECSLILGNIIKIIQLDWNPVIDENGVIEKILVSIKDVTEFNKLEQEAAGQSKELQYIGEILAVTPKQFGVFMSSAQRFQADNLRLIKTNFQYSRELVKILFINLHTVKGAARALGLKLLTPSIHNLEQYLASLMPSKTLWDREKILNELGHIQNLLDTYQTLNQSKLGRAHGESYQSNAEFIERIHKLSLQVIDSSAVSLRPLARSIKDSIEDLMYVRAGTVFREVLSNAEMLARDLNKECPRIEIEDQGIALCIEGQDLVRHTFVHIIRNSMDHGIESREERLSRGKTAEGHIRVELSTGAKGLEVLYHDDGRGLNIGAIKRKGIEKGLIKDSTSLSLEEIAYLVFEAGFSTSDSINEISGRGVGMNAVRNYVEARGGTIVIELDRSSHLVNPDFIPFHLKITLAGITHIQKAA